MGFLNSLGNAVTGLGNSIIDTTIGLAKDAGDILGFDGSFGYQGTYANQGLGQALTGLGTADYNGLSQWNVPTSTYTTNASNGVVGGLFGSLGDWLSRQNSQDWSNYANIAKGVGGLGLGYMNYLQGKKLTDAQMQQMALEQQYAQDYENRRKQNEQNAINGFNNSALINSAYI